MVIDDFPQWFEWLFVFFALIMILGVWNAGLHLAGIGRQLAALGQFLDDLNIKDIADDIDKFRDVLDDIRLDVEQIADPDAKKRRIAETADSVLKRNQFADKDFS